MAYFPNIKSLAQQIVKLHIVIQCRYVKPLIRNS